MVKENIVVRNSSGLHARPAANFVKTANAFKASVKVFYAGREADAKSILEVLSLGAGKGATISLKADGEDAALAIKALKELAEGGFHEA